MCDNFNNLLTDSFTQLDSRVKTSSKAICFSSSIYLN